jgi:S-adenosyl methyltransferase
MAGERPGPVAGRQDEPPGPDTSVPHMARIQNYWRGGTANYAADRKAAEHIMAAYPDLAHSVRANREFLARAVRFLAGHAGVRQFLDIGAGLPAAGSVHEVVRDISPQSRVVYVDNDPTVLAHVRTLLASDLIGAVDFVDADLRDTGGIVGRAGATLDFGEPIAVMLVSVLHMIEDRDDPHAIVAELMGAMPPRSFLALTHVASDLEPEAMAEMAQRTSQQTSQRATPRDYSAVTRFVDGLELIPPGIVRVPEWRPESAEAATAPSTQWGVVARKP